MQFRFLHFNYHNYINKNPELKFIFNPGCFVLHFQVKISDNIHKKENFYLTLYKKIQKNDQKP